MSLVDRKPGRRTGHRGLEAERERIIITAIKTYYLKPPGPRVRSLCGTSKPTAALQV